MPFRRLLALATVLALGSVLAAQQPTFRSATHYVRLDVVVTDSDERPIRGLTKEDFEIIERDRPQEITDFEAVEIPVESRPIDLDSPPDALSDIATNGTGPSTGRAVVIVVDDTVLDTADVEYIKRTLSAMLATFSANDYVAFTYVRRSDLGRDFTNDPVQHVRAVNELTNAIGLPAVSGLNPARDLLVTLENVAKTLAASRHPRRAIVLIGTRGCTPRCPHIICSICEGVITAARIAGTPIYPIDPTGTLGNNLVDDPLQVLAAATGGIRYRESQPWLSPARLMADNGTFYLLGYYPRPLRTDGKFQEVQVRVKRPGTYVRARRGYTAPWWNTRPVPAQRAMTASLGEGLPNPDLPIRASVVALPPGGGRTKAVVTIEVAHPKPERGFAGSFADEWRIGVLSIDPDGRTRTSFQRPITFAGTWRPDATGRIVINEVVDLEARQQTVRIGVTSEALGKTGTAHIALAVPNFSDEDVQLGGVIIGTDRDVVDAIIGLDRLNGVTPVQPTTRRTFSADETLRVFTRASWGTAAPEVVFEVGLVGQAEARQVTGRSESSNPKRQVATLDQSLPLAGLSPGRYVLRVAARLADERPVEKLIPIEINAVR